MFTKKVHLFTNVYKNNQGIIMATKTIPFSVRLSEEDAEFIANLKMDRVITPSDKIREIIREAKERLKNKKDFNYYLRSINELFHPIKESIRKQEFNTDNQSKLMKKIMDWLPEFCVVFLTSDIKSQLNLNKFEKNLIERVFELFKDIINLHLSTSAACYNPEHFDRQLLEIFHLVKVVTTVKSQLPIEE